MSMKLMMAVVAASSLAVGTVAQAGQQGQQGGQQGKSAHESAQERVDQQLGSEGNAMGVPVPGSVSDMESTEKKRDARKVEQSKTIPRMPYTVDGEILKIDGENYEVSGEKGERVSLVVNKDTNLDCAAAPTSGEGRQDQKSDVVKTDRMGEKEQAPEASDRQLAQGQQQDETARGAGFKIGNCDFKKGDRVRAQIDDNGRVTTLKYLAQGNGQSSER